METLSIETSTILLAFGVTLAAGLSTGIGSLFALLSRETDHRFLAGALGFSAGVMIYVSMIEIFVKARESLSVPLGEAAAFRVATLAFFGGMAVIALIDRLVPKGTNPHEIRDVTDMDDIERAAFIKRQGLLRMGVLSALAIGIHNFPEGLATFIGTIEDPALGIGIAVAIAIHNIPEGIAVSVPIYHATGSRRRAFTLSFLSGLAEPIGAVVGFFLLRPFMNDLVFGVLFAAVAGIMVFISLDELLPTAERYGEHHVTIYGLIVGMVVMALSLILVA